MFRIPEYHFLCSICTVQHYVSPPTGICACAILIVDWADMANQKLYEPARRLDHVSFSLEGKVYLWGGVTQNLSSGHRDELARRIVTIEQFDPYLEVWRQLNTAGTPHPGLQCAACASHGEHVYMYGGVSTKVEGILSCLKFTVKTPTWSQLWPVEIVGGPMRKISCGMVHFHDDKLAVIGGYGYPNGPIQPGSVFYRDPKATDGIGRTNEIHIFDISQGNYYHESRYIMCKCDFCRYLVFPCSHRNQASSL